MQFVFTMHATTNALLSSLCWRVGLVEWVDPTTMVGAGGREQAEDARDQSNHAAPDLEKSI